MRRSFPAKAHSKDLSGIVDRKPVTVHAVGPGPDKPQPEPSGCPAVTATDKNDALFADLEAHLSGGAAEGAERGFLAAGVHVLELDFHDVHHLLFGEFSDFRFVRFLRPGSEAGGLFQEDGGGRGFGDVGEGLVLVNRDDHRKDVARLLLRRRIEFFAEGHDVHALLTEGRADRRSRIGLPRGNLQLDLSNYFFRHKRDPLVERKRG